MTWNLDLSHSEINFAVKHMMISTVRGKFNKFSGTIDFNEADPASSSIDVSIDVASIDTKDEKRDGHLKGADFFDVEKTPQITFKATSITPIKENKFTVKGDLTLRGVTKPVTLDGTFGGTVTDPWGNEKAAFSATGVINRTDFGITWNKNLDKGGLLVGNEVTLSIEVEGALQKEAGTK